MFPRSIKYAIATAIKNLTGVTLEEAQELTAKHSELIRGAVIFPNALAIIQAEAQGFGAFQNAAYEAPEMSQPVISETPEGHTPANSYVKLGSKEIPVTKAEAKSMKRQGFTIIEK